MQPAPRLQPTPQPQDLNAAVQMLSEEVLDKLREKKIDLTLDMVRVVIDLLIGTRDKVRTRMLSLIDNGGGTPANIGLLLWAVGEDGSNIVATNLHKQIRDYNPKLYDAAKSFVKFWSDLRIDHGKGLDAIRQRLSHSKPREMPGGVSRRDVRQLRG